MLTADQANVSNSLDQLRYSLRNIEFRIKRKFITRNNTNPNSNEYNFKIVGLKFDIDRY